MTDLYRICLALDTVGVKYRAEFLNICKKNTGLIKAHACYTVTVGPRYNVIWAFNSHGAHIGTWHKNKLTNPPEDAPGLRAGEQFIPKESVGGETTELTVAARSVSGKHILVTNNVSRAPKLINIDALQFDWKPKPQMCK